MKLFRNQKGMSNVLVLVFVLLAVIVVIYLFKQSQDTMSPELPTPMNASDSKQMEPLGDDTNAPAELKNSVIDDLDKSFNDIDKDTDTETLDDLSY